MKRGSKSSLVLRITLSMLVLLPAGSGWASSTNATEASSPPAADQPQATSVAAEPQTDLDFLASLRALTGYLTPDDMNELSIYLRELVLDVVRGTQEANLPPDLAFKMAVLEQRFKKEGDAYLQQAIRNLDRDMKRFLQEHVPLPSPRPNTRAQNGN